MQFLTIGVKGDANDILTQINEELIYIDKQEVEFIIDQIEEKQGTSIICSVKSDNDEIEEQKFFIFKVHVSNALAEYIIKNYEIKMLTRIINTNYCYFSQEERKEILGIALKLLSGEQKDFIQCLFTLRRKNIIARKLIDYLNTENSILIDGFVNFRLKEYVKYLEEVIEKAVDEFLLQREYREFIRLLRYFVEIQEPKYDIVHVIATSDKKYALLDSEKREITNECIKDFICEITEGEINYDDLLVSSLITLAPRKIVIHCTGQIRNKELFDTITNVFVDRVNICKGCDLCISFFSSSSAIKH